MTTSPYTEYLRHHFETGPLHNPTRDRQTGRLLAPWRRHRASNPAIGAPRSR